MPQPGAVIPVEHIERSILLIRGHKVLNEQVRRNASRFPSDFMFRLTDDEARILRSQIATIKTARGRHRKYLPHAFTQEGVAMLSSVLHSRRAIHVNIAIMRAFVRLRRLLASNEELTRKLEAFEKRYDTQFKVIFDAIRQLMSPPAGSRRSIGFRAGATKDISGRLRIREHNL